MDKGSLYIMLWIIVLVILPFAIVAIIKRMKITKLQNGFKKLANDQNLNLSQHEVIHRNYAVGIDKDAKKIVYLNSKNETSLTVINLPEISKCKVVISDRKGMSDATNLIELIFSPRDTSKSEQKIELYNNPAFMPSSDDIAMAENWAAIANSSLV